MENERLQENQMQEITESWIKPEIIITSVATKTHGNGVAGPDFGSQES
ncbi:hypothetical protein [Dyadobacter helix]|nr:hypothetical protein [Dyadobacter sp. CECT 9275]